LSTRQGCDIVKVFLLLGIGLPTGKHIMMDIRYSDPISKIGRVDVFRGAIQVQAKKKLNQKG